MTVVEQQIAQIQRKFREYNFGSSLPAERVNEPVWDESASQQLLDAGRFDSPPP